MRECTVCANPECGNEFEAFPINKKFCSITCKRKMDAAIKRMTMIASYDTSDEEMFIVPKFDSSNFHPYVPKDDSLEFLRKENIRLNNLVNKYKNNASEVYDSILNTVKSHAEQITVKPPKQQRSFDKARPTLVCNPWNADYQLGKVTPTYNSQIAVDRIDLYTDNIIQTAEDYRAAGYPVNTAHVYYLGDIVEGEQIFPQQAYTIDSSIYEQVAKTGPTICGSQLRRLLEVFDHVHVVGVIGNHGRISKFSNPETNMDRMLYKILEHMFAYEPRITFNIPDGKGESMFWAVDSIGEYSTLLVHGDQFPSPSSLHQYWKKILGWKTSGIPVAFDDVAIGHYHQNTKFTLGETVVRISGSPESHNTFAQERIGVMGRPSQHLQMVNPETGVFWESDIYLD